MSGSATLTIVMSSRSMNVARQTASRLHHLRSIRPRLHRVRARARRLSPTARGVADQRDVKRARDLPALRRDRRRRARRLHDGRPRPPLMRSVWRDNGLSLVFLAFFLAALAGQAVAGWHDY